MICTLFGVLLGASAIAGCADVEDPAAGLGNALLQAQSEAVIQRTGDGIGAAREARFLGGAGYVVLDRYSPHLRLFDLSGRPVWSGGSEGGGPQELSDPQGLAVGSQGEVMVVQHGRLSLWRLATDSLRFEDSLPIPEWYWPLAAESGCADGEWLLYARDNRQFLTGSPETAGQPRRFDYIHRVTLSVGDVAIEPLWAPPPADAVYARTSHRAALLTRLGSTLVLYHRMSSGAAGTMYRLTCSGAQLGAQLERPLVVGGDAPVKMPQPRPMQWTNGAIPIPGGAFVVAIPRWETAPDSTIWSTELFRVAGVEVRSVLIAGQWRLYDYDSEFGALMGNDDPIPHLVVIPPERITATWVSEQQ